jgi:hypothetical protein
MEGSFGARQQSSEGRRVTKPDLEPLPIRKRRELLVVPKPVEPPSARKERVTLLEVQPDSVIIQLPENQELVGKLQAKLVEYKARLKEESLALAAKEIPPVERPPFTTATRYKILVLSELLEAGSVNVDRLKRDIEKDEGSLVEHDFDNAWRVIKDYCETGGKNTRKES